MGTLTRRRRDLGLSDRQLPATSVAPIYIRRFFLAPATATPVTLFSPRGAGVCVHSTPDRPYLGIIRAYQRVLLPLGLAKGHRCSHQKAGSERDLSWARDTSGPDKKNGVMVWLLSRCYIACTSPATARTRRRRPRRERRGLRSGRCSGVGRVASLGTTGRVCSPTRRQRQLGGPARPRCTDAVPAWCVAAWRRTVCSGCLRGPPGHR
jgi:hypothetical protein